MSAPLPQGRTSCAAPLSVSSVAAPLTSRDPGNSHALPSTSGLDTADPAPRAGDSPSRRRGRTRPENAQALRDLTRPAGAALPDDDIPGGPTYCPVRAALNVERRA